ncbi:MAG: DUF4956 domain-containing protein [Bacilli bacterium]|nr:DUF4956 domain-containing protein [Bacilli bacterium]
MKKILEALTEMQTKIPIETVFLILVVAFIVAMIIYLTYKNTYTGVMYNPRFNVSLIMITMVTTIVMVVIGSNISVSLGMVGALSIIRFRTAVKDPRDTAFIFWGVVSGLACGTQNYTIVLAGSIVICLILFGFKKVVARDGKYLLIIKGQNFETSYVEKIIAKKTKYYSLKGNYYNNGNIELIYDVRLKHKKDDTIINDLKDNLGIDVVNLVANNTDTMG